MLRYVVLEHTGAPDDPRGCHLDLLLEDGEHCRTWRLDHWPQLDGDALTAIPLPPHRLVWLERQSAAVSGGRGWARRLAGGHYAQALDERQSPFVDQSSLTPVKCAIGANKMEGTTSGVLLLAQRGSFFCHLAPAAAKASI